MCAMYMNRMYTAYGSESQLLSNSSKEIEHNSNIGPSMYIQ